MSRKLCVACDGFPYDKNPEFSFVKELCEEFVRQDIEVTIFAPQSIISILFRGTRQLPFQYSVRVGDKSIQVYRPLTLSFGNRMRKLQYRINSWVINWVIKRKHLSFDAFYGHFWHSALQLFPIAKKQRKELFVASGESHIFLADEYKASEISSFLKYVKYVFCVSSKNRDESMSLDFCDSSKCIVIPNAVNLKVFNILNKKNELRKKYNISDELFVVAFIGAFIQRKGADRLSKAIENIHDASIKGMFIGKEQEGNLPFSPNPAVSVFIGQAPHDKIVELLNCADIFVLPTLREGCSNAIIEAMACGLPIVSSNLNFNQDILDSSNSIMINPMDIDEISRAIISLKTDAKLRSCLSNGAYQKAQTLSITNRVSLIKSFIFS